MNFNRLLGCLPKIIYERLELPNRFVPLDSGGVLYIVFVFLLILILKTHFEHPHLASVEGSNF